MSIIKRAKRFTKTGLEWYGRRICREEFITQRFDKHNERPVEFAFLFDFMSRVYPKSILDIGVGLSALPAVMRNCGSLVTATDNIKDYWPQGLMNRHFHLKHDNVCATSLQGEWDLVTGISVLEHIDRFDQAVHNMVRLTRAGGHIIITAPYNERSYCQNCYLLPDSAYGKDEPYGAHSFSRREIDSWVLNNPVRVVAQQYWRFWSGALWTQGEQIIPPEPSRADLPHQHTCLLLEKLA